MIDKRELIIRAAFEVFSEKGYYTAKIEEIADKAGIGKGTVYSYFRNKQDLFDTMVFWFLEEYFLKLEAGIDENESIQVIIKKFIKNHIEILVNTKATFMNVLTDFSNIPRSKEEIMDFHQRFLLEKTERYSKIFEKAKEKGEMRNISPQLAASFLMGALKGLSEAILVLDQAGDVDSVADEVSDLLCYGVAKRDGE